MTLPHFDTNLKKYADLAVETGVAVKPGDTIYLQADVSQSRLAHLIVTAAYKAGASEVLVDWQDDTLKRLTIAHLADDRLDVQPPFVAEQFDYWLSKNAKRITVMSADPDNLAGIDAQRVARYNAGYQKAYARLSDAITTNRISWTIIAAAGASWASKVFPEDSVDTAVDKLWDQIFTTTRVYADDPNQAWRDHAQKLSAKAAWLNQFQFDALHYDAPGTDITVGLPKNHIWQAADATNPRGETFMANMPTEEVFTVPDSRRIDGTVASTKPLAYAGNVLEGMHFTFKDGQVVAFSAARGQDVLAQLLQIKGARSLGEVSLVPDPSPISQSGITFFNTLFDENASDHMALGQAYPFAIVGGTSMTPKEQRAAGLNLADTHVDFMMGSARMNIDGITASGEHIPIFRNGDWV